MVNNPYQYETQVIDNYTYDENDKLVRVGLISSGSTITSSNPLPVEDSDSNALLQEIKNQNDLLRQLLILMNGAQSLNNVDTTGRQSVNLGSIAANLTLATVTTVGAVTSLTNLNTSIPSSNIVGELNNVNFQSIRNNINVY